MMQSSGKRILQIAHNHPRFHPGGTELTALALHREALEQGLDSWYLGALDETRLPPDVDALLREFLGGVATMMINRPE